MTPLLPLLRPRLAWIIVALCSAACAGKASDSSTDGGGGASAGGSSSGGSSSGGASSATPASIVLTNGSEAPVWVQVAGRCSNIPIWFSIFEEGAELTVVGSCVTDCAIYDPDRGPLGCPAICLVDEYEELAVGASIEFDWDGASWVADPRGCSARTPAAPGANLDVTFCVVDAAFEPDEQLGIGPDPELVHCETVTVSHGASTTIEHVFEGP